MKKISTLIVLIGISLFSFGQNAGDKIIGTYLSPDGTSKMEFYKTSNSYFSRISWLKDPNDPKTHKPSTDTDNPDASKRNQPIIGIEIVKGLKFDGSHTWEKGTIYDPNTGKTWDCCASFDGNKLKLKGFWTFSWIGKTEEWSKVNSLALNAQGK